MSLRKVTLSGLLAPPSSPSCITKRQKGEKERERGGNFRKREVSLWEDAPKGENIRCLGSEEIMA